MALGENAENGQNVASALRPWEQATVEVFVRAAGLIGLPKSLGEIYGYLFCSDAPRTFDDLVVALGISKGSVSQGLKLLRQLGAVKLTYIEGSRRDHYVPEMALKRLVSGFVKDQLEPHLSSGKERLERANAYAELEPDEAQRQHALNRLQTLATWQKRCHQLLPMISMVLAGMSPKSSAGEHDEVRPLV